MLLGVEPAPQEPTVMPAWPTSSPLAAGLAQGFGVHNAVGVVDHTPPVVPHVAAKLPDASV